MSLGARREYFKQIWRRYQKASKQEKGLILNEFCTVCQYCRKYAIRLLGEGPRERKKKSGPKEIYDQAFVEVLYELWQLMRRMCGKKMKVALPEWLAFYSSEKLTKEIEKKLKKISASHIDRLLRPFKKLHGRSTTKRGSFLKTKIPIEIQHDGVKEPGYVQSDTVAHCGDHIDGAYAHSLTVTDICSNWTENRAVWRKDADAVITEFVALEKTLPFSIRGYSSDNGGEVMNERLYRYLDDHGVKITRGRPYRKNDNPHVEQKNHTHVRKLFGYQRFDHRSLVSLMNEIYIEYWNPLQNFFTPSMKLIEKERVGARMVKKYDHPQTPYQRLMKSKRITSMQKTELKQKYESLNPVYLSRQLDEKIKSFFKMLHLKRKTDPA